MRTHSKTVFVSGVITFLATSAQGTPAYFCGVGDLLGGGVGSQVYAISGDGTTVAGGSSSSQSASYEAYEALSWTASAGIHGLGDIPGGRFTSNALAVSADGAVIVGYGGGSSVTEACVWRRSEGAASLGYLPGATQTFAHGVSADGAVIVGHSGMKAFRWTQAQGMVPLPDLLGGNGLALAAAVSADGLVIVGRSESYDPVNGDWDQACRWTASGEVLPLGDLSGGRCESVAHDVSCNGQVIIGASFSELSGSASEAFRWTLSGGMVGLGDLPGGIYMSKAAGVSADGSVIVGASDTSGPQDAFIWDTVHGMRSLHQVLTMECGLDLGNWVLLEATDISADSMTICGIGRNPQGYEEGWVAHIPEPSALSLLALGSLALMRRTNKGTNE